MESLRIQEDQWSQELRNVVVHLATEVVVVRNVLLDITGICPIDPWDRLVNVPDVLVTIRGPPGVKRGDLEGSNVYVSLGGVDLIVDRQLYNHQDQIHKNLP